MWTESVLVSSSYGTVDVVVVVVAYAALLLLTTDVDLESGIYSMRTAMWRATMRHQRRQQQQPNQHVWCIHPEDGTGVRSRRFWTDLGGGVMGWGGGPTTDKVEQRHG